MSEATNSPDEEQRCASCGCFFEKKFIGGVCPACLLGTVLSDNEMERAFPQHVDVEGHDVYEEIGQGGMGMVYRAKQHHPEREVALKIVAPYSLRVLEARKRFLLEVEAMAAIEHPAVLPLYQSGEDCYGRPWLTMQLLRGGSLSERTAQYQGQWKKIAQLMVTLCDAIAYAHERGILHRDLKPANILFDEENHPYIADFGLAKWADGDSGLSQSSYLLGSPAYLAPEAAANGSSATTTVSDVYGLGAIMYELLTSKSPYIGKNAGDILTQIISGDPLPPRKISTKMPRDLEVIVLTAMARSPEKRYRSASAMKDDLERWLDGKAIMARPMGTVEKICSWARRNPALATLSALLITSILTAMILQWRTNQKLTITLNDAEARADFMVRELPARISPLGRLDLLDDVFKNVAEHYEQTERRDVESLARQADLYAQWAYTQRTRALTDQALGNLQAAYSLAKQASEKTPLSLAVVRSRISAGWRLGEVLIEVEKFPEAQNVLEETRLFLLDHKKTYGDDFQFQHLEAGLYTEIMILHTKTNQTELALQDRDVAKKLWDALSVRLEQATNSSDENLAREEAAIFPYFVSLIYRRMGNLDEREKAINEYVASAEKLYTKHQTNLLYAGIHFNALLVQSGFYLDEGRGDAAQIEKNLKDAEEKSKIIYSQEPGNIKWLGNSVFIARSLAELADKRGDKAEFTKWFDEMNERVLKYYDVNTSSIETLNAKQKAGVFCLDHSNNHSWEWQKRHYEAVLLVLREMCRQSSNVSSFYNLQNIQNRFVTGMRANEGNAAALTWLRNFSVHLDQNRNQQTATKRELWSLAEAFTWQLLADAGEADAAQKASVSFLASPNAADQMLSYQLNTIRPKQINDRMQQTIGLLQSLIKAGSDQSITRNTDTDQKLASLFLTTIPKLPTQNQIELIANIEKSFRGVDGLYRGEYRALDALKVIEK